MEFYSAEELTFDQDKNPILPPAAKEASEKTQIESSHQGNRIAYRNESNKRVTRFARSYAVVAFQDTTELTESKHVVLSCPECNTVLYETDLTKKKRKYGEIE